MKWVKTFWPYSTLKEDTGYGVNISPKKCNKYLRLIIMIIILYNSKKSFYYSSKIILFKGQFDDMALNLII